NQQIEKNIKNYKTTKTTLFEYVFSKLIRLRTNIETHLPHLSITNRPKNTAYVFGVNLRVSVK
ncbi:hypothetical protein, partial [Vibrio parahaemolyticus]|uniref:hypothetical protein n=1 Tax=Vibrio parahaemolyticus TaxID=670 RepID=UPI001C5EC3E0